MGTSVRTSFATANSLVKTSADQAHFFYTRYDRGIEFHTGITGAAGTVVADTTNTRMVILPNGKVGINETSPSEQFVVGSGNILMTGGYGFKWTGGSQLIEQTVATAGVDRMIYLPN